MRMFHLKKESVPSWLISPELFYKQALLFIFLILLLPCPVQAQRYGLLKQQWKMGSTGDDTAKRMCSDAEGNLYLLGTVSAQGKNVSEHFGCSDLWVLALQANGKVIWEKTLGGPYCDEAADIKIFGKSLWVSGATGSFLTHPESGDKNRSGDGFFVQLSTSGNILQYQTYGGNESDIAQTILPLKEGKLLWAGMSFSELNLAPGRGGASDIWVKTSGKDSTEAQGFTAGSDAYDWSVNLRRWDENTCMLCANTSPAEYLTHQTMHQAWLIFFDTHLKNRKSYLPATKYSGVIHDCIVNQDRSITLVGATYSPDEASRFWWFTCAPDGSVLQEKAWGGKGTEVLNSVKQCKDGGWILTGWSTYYHLENPSIKGGDDVWVIRLKPDGETDWVKTFGGPGNERGLDVLEYIPGVYYVLAERQETLDNPQRDLWLLRVEEEECDLPEFKPTYKLPGKTLYVGQYIQFNSGYPGLAQCVWDFGDGTSSKEQDPMKKYYRKGSYEVKFSVKGQGECRKEIILEGKLEVN